MKILMVLTLSSVSVMPAEIIQACLGRWYPAVLGSGRLLVALLAGRNGIELSCSCANHDPA